MKFRYGDIDNYEVIVHSTKSKFSQHHYRDDFISISTHFPAARNTIFVEIGTVMIWFPPF